MYDELEKNQLKRVEKEWLWTYARTVKNKLSHEECLQQKSAVSVPDMRCMKGVIFDALFDLL